VVDLLIMIVEAWCVDAGGGARARAAAAALFPCVY